MLTWLAGGPSRCILPQIVSLWSVSEMGDAGVAENHQLTHLRSVAMVILYRSLCRSDRAQGGED